MRKSKYLLIIFFVGVVALFVINIGTVFAVEPLLGTSGRTTSNSWSACIEKGDCQVRDFFVVAIRVTDILIALSGSVALLFFVYGGVLLLISGGSGDKITQAKKIISNAVIGLVILFTSYMIIDFIMGKLGVSGWYTF